MISVPSGSEQLGPAYTHQIYSLTIGTDSAELNGECGQLFQYLIILYDGYKEGREVAQA